VSNAFLEEIAAQWATFPADLKASTAKYASAITAGRRWVPNAGPQFDAYFSKADELFYGGQAGGGKTDLLIGLALTAHIRSLVLRRTNKEADKLVERFAEIIGDRYGWNGQEDVWRIDGRVIDIGGCQLENDKQKRKGIPHDLKCFDEITDFSETQYVFIKTWCRSTIPGQRSRVVVTGNPPTRPEGLWVLKRWGAWLDPKHPKPAKPGELRWYTTIDGKDTEVDGPGPHDIGEKTPVIALSRTFIPAKLSDNPDLEETGYDSVLASLPEELRAAYREGRFDLSLRDDPWQLIPTAWVQAAMDRWTPEPPKHCPQCAIGVDVARGGSAQTTLAPRYDAWFAPLIAVPGAKTPLGTDVAGLVVANRRNNATIVIDMGGGWGGAPYEHLKANNIEVVGYNGAEATPVRTKDGKLGFTNKRAADHWKLREALDPSQDGGSPVCLPPDPELMADLTALTFEHGPRGIKVEAKEAITERIGRSPDKGDAVVMAWSAGPKVATHGEMWRKAIKTQHRPEVNRGHESQRRNR
jgi:hypothetical protein